MASVQISLEFATKNVIVLSTNHKIMKREKVQCVCWVSHSRDFEPCQKWQFLGRAGLTGGLQKWGIACMSSLLRMRDVQQKNDSLTATNQKCAYIKDETKFLFYFLLSRIELCLIQSSSVQICRKFWPPNFRQRRFSSSFFANAMCSKRKELQSQPTINAWMAQQAQCAYWNLYSQIPIQRQEKSRQKQILASKL